MNRVVQLRCAAIDFGSGATQIRFNIAMAFAGTRIQLRSRSPGGTLLGDFAINSTDSFGTFTEHVFNFTSPTGVGDVNLVFTEDINLDWMTFSAKAIRRMPDGTAD